ncbi:hypothetical protein SADUNF_SadunfMtG0001400 (mitochondrion) [Salix dunnii]|uniref:Photosystem I P700 apoprotein A1 n=1 Tax=Salix dunnii TaxID=1413687 RepID=A0A835IZH7_9ROSI|nr:hypothetical protein SADUNF_SadunfMtG0001400 [Salix dunnii]
MIIRSPEPEVKILVDRDPIKTSFEEWARPGHFSRTIAKGPDTTTWIWNLHADAHDFDSHTSDLEEISRKVFSAHFGQLSIIFLWLSGMYFHGARFSNYEAWLSDPTHIGPSAQVVWPIVGQEILNGDVRRGFQGIQRTSGFFFQIWRASGITSELQLYCTAIGALVFAALMLFADPVTGGLWLTDIAHHHLAIAILFLVRVIRAEILTTSWHAQLSLNLAMLGSLTIVVAHHMYSMPPYPYLATDYGTQLSLFTHHMWIGVFLIVGAVAHAAIFMVRDYDPTTRYNDLLDRVLRHRDAIISHLNWVCIFLGFHSFGLYIHNDTMSALGRPQDIFSDTAIQLQPVFAQWIQNTHALAPGATASTSLTWGGDDLVAVGGDGCFVTYSIRNRRFLFWYIHAFTIHVTVLILLKGVLFARSSRLIPDKANLGFRFPTWKRGNVWGSISDQGVVTHITGGNFAQSSITINGWLRDFLWAQASQVVQSYGSSLSAYGLFFLGAHFVWAFKCFYSAVVVIELIESIVWAHNKFKVAPATQPRASRIIQGRAVGVTHYLLGGIDTTWAFFLARIIAVG